MIEKISLTNLASKKLAHLEQQGYVVIGVIMSHPDAMQPCQRVTVDNWGRTQWWPVDGSGKMGNPTRLNQ